MKIHTNIFTFLIPFFLLLNSNFGQNLNISKSKNLLPFVVDSIAIQGNKTTKNFIILRELNFGVGDTVNQKMLIYNKERIFSLRIFNKVSIVPQISNRKNIVNIMVDESWYIYPLPFLMLRQGSWQKASYGMLFDWKNFRGRNETITGLISFGYDPQYGVSYFNPVLIRSMNISFRTGLFYKFLMNKSKIAKLMVGNEFEYKIFNGFIGLGKRISLFNEFNFLAGFQYLKAPKANLKGVSASKTSVDRVPYLKLQYTYDTRNLKQFSNNGIFANIEITHKGFGVNGINYNLLNVDYREYKTVFKLFTSRWRIALRHTFGKLVPYYDYSYLGFNEIVRGHKNDIREGNNLIITSLELNYPIIKQFDFSIKLPLLPQKLTSARLGLYLTTFGDAGIVFNNNENISINKFEKGFGFGFIILILPYNAFRIEYAFDGHLNGEFNIGTGFSF